MGGHRNRPWGEPPRPRPARRRRRGPLDSARPRRCVRDNDGVGIGLQRISLGALIIALGLLVDDAMITIESMVTRLERGDEKEKAASFAYSSTAFPRLAGTLVTIAAFVPIGFARSAAGEYTFSIFAVVAIALIASWIVAALFTPMLGVWMFKKPKEAHSEEHGPVMRAFRHILAGAMPRWVTSRPHRFVRGIALRDAPGSAAVLPGF